MYTPLNQVQVRGFLTEPARTFVSRSGQPRLTFRVEVWIDDPDLPPKKPLGVDYFSIVAFGAHWAALVQQLSTGREVTVVGRLRSRDVDGTDQRVVTEIVAKEIHVLGTRADALRDSLQPAARLGCPSPAFQVGSLS
jgi:single-stranded DNA-binding protein